ncbi:MAG: hypothetical protein EU542_03160 [Promethearchaeota archaeon]|nr:MAG: hypothetical protein EU542_03160 [Candidatus Lokiarchaeota archaeon]
MNEKMEEDPKMRKFQIANMILSLLFILISVLFAYLIEYPIIVLIIIPIVVLITYYEQKSNVSPPKYSRFIYIIGLVISLGAINFWIIPLALIFYQLNIQVIVFSIILYLLFEFFTRYEYFKKETVLVGQFLLMYLAFILIAYSFFPIFTFEFSSIPNEIAFGVLNIIAHIIINLLVLLGAFYYLYIRHLQRKSTKVFNISILTIFFLTELLFLALISLLNFYRLTYDLFILNLLITINLIPIIFLVYLVFNFALGITPKEFQKKMSYGLFWIILIISSFSIIWGFYPSFQITFLTLLIFSIISQLLISIGWKMGFISEKNLKKLRLIFLIAIYLEIFILTFTSFFDLFQLIHFEYQIIFSTYLSLLILTIFHNIVSNIFQISKVLLISLNILILFFTNLLIFLFCMELSLGTYYILIIPVLFSCLFLFIPLLYIKSIVKTKIVSNKLILANLYIVSMITSSSPYFIAFEMIKLGYTVDFLTPLNLSLYIIYIFLIFFYVLFKNLKFKEENRDLVLKIQVGIEIVIAFTTIFYYINQWLRGTAYEFILPILATSTFLYLPLLFSYKKGYFSKIFNKQIIILDTLILWGCIISLPIFAAIELTILGLIVDLNLIFTISSMLIFIFLLFLNFISNYLRLKSKSIEIIKIFQLINWILICVLLSRQVYLFLDEWFHNILLQEIMISISIIAFLLLNLINLPILESFKQVVFENRKSRYDFYKIYKTYEYTKNIIYFGLIFSIAFSICLLPQQISLYSLIFIGEPFISPLIIQILIFLLLCLVFLHNKPAFFRIEFVKFKFILEMICWFSFKILVCIISILIPFELTLVNRIFFGILIFSLLSPISMYYLNEQFIILESSIKRIKEGICALFLISIMSFFVEFYWLLNFELSLFTTEQILIVLNTISIIYLYLNFTIIYYRNIVEDKSSVSLYRFFGFNSLLLISVILINSIFFLLFILIVYSLLLYNRNKNIIFRLITYLALSIFFFNELIINFDAFNYLKLYTVNEGGIFLFLGLVSIISVLIFSIVINSRGENFIERHLLYIFISSISYISFFIFTSVAQIYSITISISILLLLLGISLRRQRNEVYKWFIGLSIILLTFDLVLFISETFLFTGILFQTYKTVLSHTLTLSLTGILFISIFYSASEKSRKYSFYSAFGLLLVVIPNFIYFFLISLFSLPLYDPIVLIISIDAFIFLFYVSIALYQGKLTWQVWRTGWWLWIVIPLANFYLIYESLAGIDLFTSSLSLFGLINVNGSFIISVMICIVISLPFWYSWIKKYFSETLLIVWGLSLFALYWLSQNIFASSLFFTNFLFAILAVFLLIPVLLWWKWWRLLSIFWIGFAITIIVFLLILFSELGFLFEINYSLNIIIAGGFFIIASFFPTLRAQKNLILVISYGTVIIGVFLTIFYVNYFIFLNFSVALAISLIVMGLSLFTSRIFKLKQSLFNMLISLVLISGFSLLTYSTFSLIPEFELIALFLTMTVAGISFFIFNHYKLILGIQKLIPLAILSLGLSLSLSSVVLIFFPEAIFLTISVFLSINILFFYYALYEKRFLSLYLIPIPITTSILEILRLFEIFQPLHIFILISLMIYTTLFQIFLNLANPNGSTNTEEEYEGFLKIYNDQKRIKIINFSALVLNSTYLSLFISFISQLSLFYQILEFFITWSILILLSLRYFRKWELDKEFIDIASTIFKFGSIIALLLYFEISILFFGIFFEFFLIEFQISLIISLIVYFIISLFDMYVIKQGYRHLMNILNIIDYLFLSAYLFVFLNQYLYINANLLLLFIILFLGMQFYTNYAIFHYLMDFESLDNTQLSHKKAISKNIIINLIFLSVSLYGASFISNVIQQIYSSITFISLLSSYIMIFSVFMYIFNFIVKTKYRTNLTAIFFITFQLSLLVFWISFFSFLNLLNLFYISLLVIVQTAFSFYSVHLLEILFKAKIKGSFKPKIYAILSLFMYFEVSLLIFSISINYLDIYGSLLGSQIVLLLLSLLEIERLNKGKIKLMLIIRLVSYFTISLMLLVIFGQMHLIDLSFLYLGFGLFTFMQFYSSYLYYKIRKDINPEKEAIFSKYRRYREKFFGIIFYLVLITYVIQMLLGLELELQFVLFIASLIAHLLMLGDNYIFKFMGKYGKIFILVTWGFIFGFSSWYFISWILLFSFPIIPIITLSLLVEITYLYQILPYSGGMKISKEKIKSILLALYYLNFVSWPLYYISFDYLENLNLILLSMGISLVLLLIDKNLKVISDKLRKDLINLDIFFIGAVVSFDLFFFLEFSLAPNLLLNMSVALLIFMLFMGFLIKPFKRKRILSFAYWTSLFVLLSLIIYNLTISGFSWGFLLFGIILYPFIFMLEELKLFLNNIASYIKIALYKIKNAFITFYYNLVNFLKRNFKYIRVLICLGFGILVGLVFSDFVLGLLNILHSVLLALAIFGILYGLIPGKKATDLDEVFEQKMKRFITIWISTSLFIYVLILPYIESFIYSLILMTSSILGLGAILLIFIYRKEKRQKISIKWRFYTTIVSILLMIVWVALIIIWYFTEVRI